MKVRFDKAFYKDWFVFPFCIIFDTNIIEYIVPAKRLSIHFLWWHFGWTFFKEGNR